MLLISEFAYLKGLFVSRVALSQFRKYALPFLLCGRELETQDEVSETTVETSNRVSPA